MKKKMKRLHQDLFKGFCLDKTTESWLKISESRSLVGLKRIHFTYKIGESMKKHIQIENRSKNYPCFRLVHT